MPYTCLKFVLFILFDRFVGQTDRLFVKILAQYSLPFFLYTSILIEYYIYVSFMYFEVVSLSYTMIIAIY